MTPLKQYLFLNTFYLLLLVTLVNTYNCPDYCNCSIINNGNKTIDYTKCTSLEGLKKIEKNLPIEYLDLSNIGITKITTQIRLLRNLTSVNLSKNLLSDVSKLGSGITTLDLSHNYFTSGKLSKIPTSVVNLNLSFNEITYLPIGLKNLRLLKTLELVGNPINCTCETLMVRNWLQEKYVWTDEHIKCSLPLRFKGRPWLQVKQSDVCEHRTLKPRSSYNWDDDDDDNDLMLGDQPVFEDGSGEVERDSSDELNRDFLLVNGKMKVKNSTPVDNITYDESDGSGDSTFKENSLGRITVLDEDENESSGDNSFERNLTDNEQNSTPTTEADDDDDGSGSGGGVLLIVPRISDKTDDDDDDSTKNTTADVGYDEDDDQNEYVSPLTPGLGIFGNGLTQNPEENTPDPPIVEEEVIDKSRVLVHSAPPTASPNDVEKLVTNIDEGVNKGEMINEESTSQSKSTYVLLTVLGVILVGLIVFVAMKRRKRSSRSRTSLDPEMPRGTELLDMDKKLLGKPIEKNGNSESAPLMGDKEKSDLAKPIKRNDSDPFRMSLNKKLEEPLLQSDNSIEEPNSRVSNTPMQSFKPQDPPSSQPANNNNNNNNNSNNNNNNNNNKIDNPDLNDKRPVPSPRKEIPAPVHEKPFVYADNNSPTKNNDDDVFMPAVAAANARYSPVYSPDTGRVKIKLSETPKPKTPLLVTRSRSNAGDIITTPTLSQRATP